MLIGHWLYSSIGSLYWGVAEKRGSVAPSVLAFRTEILGGSS